MLIKGATAGNSTDNAQESDHYNEFENCTFWTKPHPSDDNELIYIVFTQLTHDVIIMSLLNQDNMETLFWHHNDTIILSYVSWWMFNIWYLQSTFIWEFYILAYVNYFFWLFNSLCKYFEKKCLCATKHKTHISTKFCTCHNNTKVGVCAKFCGKAS